jgi:hypothetical protein
MGASLPTRIKVCFNAMETSHLTFNHKARSLILRHQLGKVMFNVFWNSLGVLLTHFQKSGENVNSASYGEVLLKLRDAIRRKFPGQLARGILAQ